MNKEIVKASNKLSENKRQRKVPQPHLVYSAAAGSQAVAEEH